MPPIGSAPQPPHCCMWVPPPLPTLTSVLARALRNSRMRPPPRPHLEHADQRLEELAYVILVCVHDDAAALHDLAHGDRPLVRMAGPGVQHLYSGHTGGARLCREVGLHP